MSRYYPNREPVMLLKCGAVESAWGMLKRDRKWWQWCPDHDILEQVMREATVTEIISWKWPEDGRQERLF